MIEASRRVKGKALGQYSNRIDEGGYFESVQDPGTAARRCEYLTPPPTPGNPGKEMLVRDFLRKIGRELNSSPVGEGK